MTEDSLAKNITFSVELRGDDYLEVYGCLIIRRKRLLHLMPGNDRSILEQKAKDSLKRSILKLIRDDKENL